MKQLKQLVMNFEKENCYKWKIVTDNVMGGISEGAFQCQQGIGIFHGNISLENRGGFSSARRDIQLGINDIVMLSSIIVYSNY